MFPTRYTRLVGVREKHGRRADEVAAYFSIGDARADAVVTLFNQLPPGRGKKMFDQALEQGIGAVPNAPQALRELFEQVEHVPLWLDPNLLELGCRTHLRCGLIGGIVLGCCSLPLAYRSAAGNKPLMFTRFILERSTRRLSETNRFFLETCLPGSLLPRGPGWKTTVQVRLMHAQMRHLLRDPRKKLWKTNDWGVPINQVDLAATRLLFCANLLRCLRRIGFHFAPAETEGIMHLWRYSGYLLGVDPELLCATETEGHRFQELLLDVAGTPDEHSVQLTEALLGTAIPQLVAVVLPGSSAGGKPSQGWMAWLGQRVANLRRGRGRAKAGPGFWARFCFGLSHSMVGDRVARELAYPDTAWRHTAPLLLRSCIVPLESCRRLLPGGTALAYWLGRKQMEYLMKNPRFASRPSFAQPPTPARTPAPGPPPREPSAAAKPGR